MDFRRIHSNSLSLAVSAMITTSFFATAPAATISAATGPQPAVVMHAIEAIHGSGWHGIKEAAAPAAAPTPRTIPNDPAANDAPHLTSAQILKLSQLLAKFSRDLPPDPIVTNALGLTRDGESIVLRQLDISPDHQTVHAYIVTPDGGYLYIVSVVGKARSYRANSKQELVVAVEAAATGAPVVIPAADAKKELQAEIVFWASVADTH